MLFKGKYDSIKLFYKYMKISPLPGNIKQGYRASSCGN